MFDFLKRLFSPPASVPADAAPALPRQPAPQPPQAGNAIPVPFSDIVARLPASLAPLVLSPAAGAFPLPVKTALAQLPSGAVRIRFAELRQSAPPGTFDDDASLDETWVDLPLPGIVAAMNPALLARRPGQTQVEVPKDIPGVFRSKDKAPARAAAPGAAPVVPTTPPSPVAPRPAPAVPQKPAAPAPVTMHLSSAGGALTVRLSALCEFWPDPVRQDIARSNWSDASVSLPMNRLDAAMKTGRVVFTWGELIQWLGVSSASISPPHREMPLELPLKVIAPLFMAHQRATVVQKNIVVGGDMPNLFAVPGKPSGQTAPAPAPAPKTVSPSPVPAPAPANVLGEIFGQPAKSEWSPQEITQKINALPGVAASLIAMSDGLLVAGDLPPPLKPETMAAFLPQIFGRLAHYSVEIQLGPPTALTLLAGQTPCTIFKTGPLYLAVLGKPGESLPDALLQRLAAELAKRNQ
jgi:predicted regulator of Ras-like GTPase activity (Roadblock/LC7/MglB family)